MIFISYVRALCALFCAWQTAAKTCQPACADLSRSSSAEEYRVHPELDLLLNKCLQFTTCFTWQSDANFDSGSLLEQRLSRGVATPDRRFSARFSGSCAVENLYAVVAGCDFHIHFTRTSRLAALGIVIPWYKKMRSRAFVRRLPVHWPRGRRFRGSGLRPVSESIALMRQPFLFICTLLAHLTAAGARGEGRWLCTHVGRFWHHDLLTGSPTCLCFSAHPGPKSRAAQAGFVLKSLGSLLLGGGARVPALITRCWGSSSRTSRLHASTWGRSMVSGMRLHQAYLLLLFLRHLHHLHLLVACRVLGLFGQWLQGGCSLGVRVALGCQRRRQGLAMERGRLIGKVVASTGGWRLFVLILLACNVCAAGHKDRGGRLTATVAQKRSFRRACGRALRNDAVQPGLGGTWYRGRWHTVQDLQARRFASSQGVSYRSRERKLPVGDRFVHMLTLNAGGLSAAAYDELLIWLCQPQCARYSVVVVEETWWKQDSMYCDQNWHFVHSAGSTGSQGKNTGILVMIRKSFVPEGCVKHRAVIPGRVLRVRLEQQKNFHLVCVYQHAWSHQIAQETMLARRERVWDAIRQVVQGVPIRDHCYILGDMNTPCVTRAGHCGAGVLEQPNPPPDVETFMGILEALDLCVLNSWSTRSRSATYVHTKGKSQIDFVITRRLDAHPISRRACPLPDAGLFEWRGGGRHLPLSVCVPARRFMPDRSATAQVQPSFDLVHLREAVGAGLAEAGFP